MHPVGRVGGPPLMVASTGFVFVLGLAVAVAAGPLYGLCERAATDLLAPGGYIHAVLGRRS